MSDGKVKSLSGFVDRVHKIRCDWGVSSHKEMWYRGESQIYRDKNTFLRPELYRPRKRTVLKQTPDLLEIEVSLHEHFKRCAVQLSGEKAEDENWDWDSYFLMQHHCAPTRLLDWSDGSQVALHFAVRRGAHDDIKDAIVYVLEPDRLRDQLNALSDHETIKTNWTKYIKKYSNRGLEDDDWADSYLPADEDKIKELPVPIPPLVLDFPHITRRVAAQRSRFVVFGTDPTWLSARVGPPDFPIREIIIDGKAKGRIRLELRDSGITESVIFPDLDGLGREIKQIWEEQK